MDFLSLLVLLGVGCAAGLAAGYFAFDVGILVVPILLLWYRSMHVSFLVSPYLAVGAAVLVGMVVAAVETSRDHRAGFVVWGSVPAMAAGGMVGAVIGALVLPSLPGQTVVRMVAVMILVAAVQQFGTRRKSRETAGPKDVETLKLGAFAIVGGVACAWTSVCNKVIDQPLLYRVLHLPLKRSIGTANAATLFPSFAAGVVFLFLGRGEILLPPTAIGYFDPGPTLALAVGAALFTLSGRSIRERMPSKNASLVSGILLLAIGIKLLVAP